MLCHTRQGRDRGHSGSLQMYTRCRPRLFSHVTFTYQVVFTSPCLGILRKVPLSHPHHPLTYTYIHSGEEDVAQEHMVHAVTCAFVVTGNQAAIMRLHYSVLLANQMCMPANHCYAVCSPKDNLTIHCCQWKTGYHFSDQTVIALHPGFCLFCLWPLK